MPVAKLKIAERRPKTRAGADATANPAYDLVWQGADYPSMEPGIYEVRGVKIQGPDWLKHYSRWSLRIEFALVHQAISVSAFFNMGNDPAGVKVGRRSNYWKAWTLANGEPPCKGERMSPERFLEGQFFRVQVEHVKKNDDGSVKSNAETYSRITNFISAERV